MGNGSSVEPSLAKYPYRRNCPYCGNLLELYEVELDIIYEIPRNPPVGARDLGFKERMGEHERAQYATCSNCGAKYEVKGGCLGEECEFYGTEKILKKDFLLDEFIKKSAPRALADGTILRKEAKIYRLDPNEKNPNYSSCFIATSVYGSPDALEVRILRKFRDNFLLENFLGKSFISFYYCLSPFLVRHLKNKKKIKFFIKIIFLDPIVNLISSDKGEKS